MLKAKSTFNFKIFSLSFIIVMILSFIPQIGIKEEGPYTYYGFPARWLGNLGEGDYSFELFGLLFNLALLYFLLIFFKKMIGAFKASLKGNNKNGFDT
ncbi:MAG: hypothetical protein WBV10_13250 [Exiguobacterium marinum]|uniref:hypothetical protein n=1 Tax=Exiguobacterium marinum TaxID=273528 RepID=UPI003C676F97